MNYFIRILIAIDQFFAVVLFGCMPDETISAMAHRRQWNRLETFINWLFRDDAHCMKAYISELVRSHSAKSYQTINTKE